MPYVTHPVRRVRDDPAEGETVDLLVRVAEDTDAGGDEDTAGNDDAGGADDADAAVEADGAPEAARDVAAVAGALRELGATDVEDRGLGALTATVPQPAVAAVCEFDGLASVETTDSLAMHLDGAGEDVEY